MDFQNESNRSRTDTTFYEKLCAKKYKIALTTLIILVVCYMMSNIIIGHISLTTLTAAVNKKPISVHIEKVNLKTTDSLATLLTLVNGSKAHSAGITESSFIEYGDPPPEYYPTEYNYTDSD